jgi:hypothetical protein
MECKKAMSINPTSPYNYKSVQPTQAVPVANRNSSPVPTVARPPAQTPKKKSSFSWPLALAGVATLLVGLGVVAFRKDKAKRIKELPELLETIFRKPYTPEETKAMVKTYQDLLKIEDKKTFIEQAFQQIKKDKGLEDVNVSLEILQKIKKNKRGGEVRGQVVEDIVRIKADLSSKEKLSSEDQETLFNTVAHELNHVRQYREIIQAGLFDDYIKVWVGHTLPKKVIAKNKASTLIGNYKEVKKKFSHAYGDVTKPSIQKGTPRYLKAEEYLKGYKDYDKQTHEEYLNNPLEIESRAVGDAMQCLVRTIKLYNL